MGIAHRTRVAIIVGATVFVGLGLLSQQRVAAESHRIIDGSTVTVFYRITIPGDQGFEARAFGQFVQGQHQVFPTLERDLVGMKEGDEKLVKLSPEEGFGPYDVTKQRTIPRSDLPAGTKKGDVLEDRAGQQATVTQLSTSSAVVDYNHPLAGKHLRLKIRILRVDDPS